MIHRFLLTALLISSALFAQKKPVTLDAILGGGRGGFGGGSPIWAPDGKSFVYQQGARLWLYDMTAKSGKEWFSLDPLTKAAAKVPPVEKFEWENRRVRGDSVQWLPSGKDLLVVSGGDLFLIHPEPGNWDQLTNTPVEEQDPKISPDGRQVAFRRGHDLVVIDLQSKKETRLTKNGSESLRNGELDWVYPEELDLGTAFWWSPDSKSIAYLQFDVSREPLYPHADLRGIRPVYEPQRYPQAGDPNADVRLGVIAAEGGDTRWMDIGETRNHHLIPRVQWMPDSRRLAVERLSRVQDRIDLLSADIKTGATRTILSETDPFWINTHDDLHFLKQGREFLWSSERDGYRHLYLYSIDGKELRRLTAGEWEVRGVAGVDEENDRVFFLSSEDSPIESQLYSIRLNGKDKRRLTADAGTHSVSMSPASNYFLDSWSSLESPTRRVLRTMDGTEYAVYREADRRPLEEYEILPSEILKIKAADGKTDLYARMIKPSGFQPGKKYPAVVMVYGGPGVRSVHNAWSGISWDQALAYRGFVIWEVDNRGTIGRGRAFESAIYRKMGSVELADQKAGVEHLISLGFVDPNRIGVYGWSYGGFMTLNCLLNAPEVFHAGISGAPVTNFINYDTIYTERYMGLPSENPDGYQATNLSLVAGHLKGKLLLVDNIEDDNVLFQNMLQMVDALERAGRQFQLMIYPQKSHGVGGPVRRQMLETMTRFLEESLHPGL